MKKERSEYDSMLDNQSLNFKGSHIIKLGTFKEVPSSSIHIQDESFEDSSFSKQSLNNQKQPILRKMTAITIKKTLAKHTMIIEADEDITPR